MAFSSLEPAVDRASYVLNKDVFSKIFKKNNDDCFLK
jgi:hypothetical protein